MHFSMTFFFSIFLLIFSIPFAHSNYEFSKEQQIDIGIKLHDFWKWLLEEAYPKMREAKSHQIRTPIVKSEDIINWREIKLPRKDIIRSDILSDHFTKIFKEKILHYFHKLSDGQLDKEKKATDILEDLAISLQKYRVEMSEWMEAKLENEWRQQAVLKGEKSVAMKEGGI